MGTLLNVHVKCGTVHLTYSIDPFALLQHLL